MAPTFRTAIPKIDVGSVGRVLAGADKHRPAVVFAIKTDADGARMLLIAHGTGTHRPELDPLEVKPERNTGRMLGLTKPTYFEPRNVVVLRESDARFKPSPGRWPLALVLRLAEKIRAAEA